MTRSRRANQQRLRKILIGVTIAVVVVVVIAALILTRSTGASASALTNPNGLNPAPQMLPVGSKAPDFSLPTADGQNVSLSSVSGHPVVLEFFAIWCPHCQNESSILNQVDTNFASKGEHTLAVLANPYGKNYDTSGGTDTRLADRNDLSWFQTTFNVKHPALIDQNFNVVNQYGASSYPTIYVIDSSGVIRFAQSGEVPYQTLADALNQVH